MNRSSERTQRRSAVDVSRRNNFSSSQESSSSSDSNENLPYTKSTSTPVRSRWTDSGEAISRSRNRQSPSDTEDTEEESSDEKELESPRRHNEETHGSREKHQDERVAQKQKRRHDRRGRRRHDKRFEDSENEEKKETSPQSSGKRYGDGDADHSKRKSRDFQGENELPITEILKRSQENARTKYEDQPPLPELTTDKIYVQYRDGFSAMKISRSRGSRAGRKTETDDGNDIVEKRDSPPIRVAIRFQQCSKSIGLVFQGLLGGMALMHFIMLNVLFETSMEFVIDHSTICEIYANIFSFCIALCIVCTLDKFDLARFDMYHLREIYSDYNKAVIAVPLYLIVFCLHQISSGTDNRLASVHYYNASDTVWENVSSTKTFTMKKENYQRYYLRFTLGYPYAKSRERFNQLAEDIDVKGHTSYLRLAVRFPQHQG
ncbi:splicing regulatory glutamine/lysine-rich protein 1-like isoform X3 [Hylaeus volcanicus]|uniref:splicing regulatory glutamine/lysine-rich protein 1-like isoform X3 n=1 Tax=Hylaeus volcanicus TaxID=313075 RepID=UPI0023B841F7|nr:splicing regulatory glutamine/lysine-rich protein 1-like isoform X3 [Hylaeus volcanicus]